MTVTSHSRGWDIEWLDGLWVWSDTLEVVTDDRPCKRCGKRPTLEGYDACLGHIPQVDSACCGHGIQRMVI